jgi:hypothetical protein
MQPPYFLNELWQSGFPKLKLAIFQLEFLMRLKVPCLAKHLAAIDLTPETFLAPWLLTIFTSLVRLTQEYMPLKTLQEIWDCFLVKGWPGLLAVVLCLLHLSQEYVLHESYEDTIEVLICGKFIPYDSIWLMLPRFEVGEALLEDLERAHYMSP